jgi:hypothetical protein
MGHAVKLGGYLPASAAAGGVRHSTVDPSTACRRRANTQGIGHAKTQNPTKTSGSERKRIAHWPQLRVSMALSM